MGVPTTSLVAEVVREEDVYSTLAGREEDVARAQKRTARESPLHQTPKQWLLRRDSG